MTSQMFYTRAYSVKLDSWFSLGAISNRLFEQDFCADDALNLKILTNTVGGSKIRFKEIFNFKNGVQISDDIRVCLPIRSDGTLYTRLRNNVMKIQYDHGIEVWKGFVFDSYASLNFTKNNSQSTNFQVGTIFLGRKYFFDNLFKLSKNYVRWYHKTMIKLQNYKFGLVGVMDFTSSDFLKKDVLLGYYTPKYQFYALATQGWGQLQYQSSLFSCYKLSLIYKQNLHRCLGIETIINKDFKSVKQISGIIQQRFGGRNRMKVKVNNKFTLNFLWQMQMNEHLVFSLGFKTGLKQNGDSKFGSKLEINI